MQVQPERMPKLVGQTFQEARLDRGREEAEAAARRRAAADKQSAARCDRRSGSGAGQRHSTGDAGHGLRGRAPATTAARAAGEGGRGQSGRWPDKPADAQARRAAVRPGAAGLAGGGAQAAADSARTTDQRPAPGDHHRPGALAGRSDPAGIDCHRGGGRGGATRTRRSPARRHDAGQGRCKPAGEADAQHPGTVHRDGSRRAGHDRRSEAVARDARSPELDGADRRGAPSVRRRRCRPSRIKARR